MCCKLKEWSGQQSKLSKQQSREESAEFPGAIGAFISFSFTVDWMKRREDKQRTATRFYYIAGWHGGNLQTI